MGTWSIGEELTESGPMPRTRTPNGINETASKITTIRTIGRFGLSPSNDRKIDTATILCRYESGGRPSADDMDSLF